ncbi:MAG: 6-bladed beta-propeller [Bacteroidota bacterium]|nr:6-bladed beta-propeller [Bacteroidota bacterium]
MKITLAYLLAISCLILTNCTNETETSSEIIEINITEALNNRKNFPLSELVNDVEILELESNLDCFIMEPQFWFLGEKYILIWDFGQMQLFLFDRNGKFVSKIGKTGKGPGEYYGMMLQGTMSKDETKIIITDSGASRVIVYNLSGKVLIQKDLSEYFSAKYILGMECHFDNLISFMPHRPWEPSDNFSSLVLFDLALNKVGEVLPRANDKDLVCANIQHCKIFAGKDGAYFWEMYNDTVYQYSEDGSSFPKYRFTTEKNNLTRDVMYNQQWSLDIYEYIFPWSVHYISGFLVVHIVKDGQTVLYNLKTEESFSIGRSTVCLKDDEQEPYNCIENDIFGFEPTRIWHYSPDQNLCVDIFDGDRIIQTRDMNCIRKLSVSRPDIRDQLLEYCENPSDDQGPVLVLMHMK